jgi:hypothetical protein
VPDNVKTILKPFYRDVAIVGLKQPIAIAPKQKDRLAVVGPNPVRWFA